MSDPWEPAVVRVVAQSRVRLVFVLARGFGYTAIGYGPCVLEALDDAVCKLVASRLSEGA